MKLLPSTQTARQIAALKKLLEGSLTVSEPCNCDGAVRHNNGGNYHSILTFRLDGGKVWVDRSWTGDYAPDTEWVEIGFGEAVEEIASRAGEGWRIH